jgi:dTDP-4-dehydrorhamnose reductase
MLKLGRERDKVRVVNDQVGSPTFTPDLARGVWELVSQAPGGLYQLSNAGEVAFDEYTREIFDWEMCSVKLSRFQPQIMARPPCVRSIRR